MKKTTLLNLRVILLIILFGSNLHSSAQQTIEFKKGGKISFDSEVLNENRTITIHLPPAYNFTNQKYPVLYLLDGPTHLKHAIGAVDFLADLQLIPDQIIVSIHNVDRTRDFSPVKSDRFPTSGGADKFLRFLTDEIIPSVEDNLRASGFSTIMGHSFGGTFITYALLNRPEVFDAFIGISPYLQYADNYVVNLAEQKLRSKYRKTKHYYMLVGMEPEYLAPLNKFRSLIKEKSPQSINISYEKLETETHGTTPYPGMYKGLRFIFSDWQLPREKLDEGLQAVDDYYKNLSKKYGYKVITPEFVVNVLGYRYLQKGEVETAIAVFKENSKRYKNSPNVYDSLGEAYENNNQYKESIRCYQKAYDLGRELGDPNSGIYLKNLNRVKANL